MALDLSYDLVNDTPASASPVESNFNTIEAYVNQECVTRDGATAMTAQLRLVGNPAAALDAAPKQYVDAVLPIGIVMMYGGAAAPPGGKWALANGASLATVTYPDLFAIIGYTYGGAGGSFSLPNLGGRVPVGPGSGVTLGSTGGSADAAVVTHTHAIDHNHAAVTSAIQSADHTHAGAAHTHSLSVTGSTNTTGSHTHSFAPFAGFINGSDALLDIHDGGASQGYSLVSTPGNAGDHSHTVTASGTSGAASATTTGVNSVDHTHSVDVPNFTGTSGSTGVAATGLNMQPYVGISFVIRVL